MTNKLKTLAFALVAASATAGTAMAAPSDATAPLAVQPATATCSGLVTDPFGEPLIGATVRVVGTNIGTAADFDGRFSLKNVEIGSTIQISYVGYETQTFKWDGKEINAVLNDNNQLDEVVVVGFGTQKKVNLTGAVSTVSSKEIASRPVNTVADALQGMAAGLDVLSAARGGQLGAPRTMNIRGTGTIGSGSSVNPLVLIDGMEGDINQLNPDDVENISVLKDASASSIYGSRAAGGVILITTKQGKSGKVTINYSDNFRWSNVTRMPKMANSYIWASTMNQAAIANRQIWFSQEQLDNLKKLQDNPSMETMYRNPANNHWEVWDVNDILPLGNTDWLDEHFGKTSFSQEHNVSLTGGNDNYNFYFSGNFLDQGGILRHGDDSMKRYTVSGKINVNLTKWLTFGYSTRWYRGNYDAPCFVREAASNELYHNICRYWPIIPAYDPNGNPVPESFIDAMENGGRYKTYNDKFDQQFAFHARPLEGLNINAEFNYRTIHQNTNQDIQQCYGWDCDGNPYAYNPNGYPYGAGGTGSQVYNDNTRANYFNPNIYGDYSHTFAEAHNFKIMLGFQSEWYSYQDFWGRRNGIINRLPFLSTTNGNTTNVGGGKSTWSTAGWFGRINYDYAGRYLVEGNLRYDGSSRFRADTRWTWSPSFSLGWNIANENFWEDFAHTCNLLKLRYSWGKLGNQNTNSWYPTYVQMGYSAAASGWLINDGTKKGDIASMPGLVSSTLTWEKNRTWDIGLDWGLFNNRLTGSFDYYNRKTIDMVGPGHVLPDVFGATVPNVNNLEMTAKGWELTISWRDKIGNVSYGITGNLYDHTVTVDKYPENPTNYLGQYYPGRQIGEIWGLTTVGIAKTDKEMQDHLANVDQSWLSGSGWTAGDVMYADLDGDHKISSGEYTLEDHGDFSIIGNTTPRFSFGLNLEAAWNGFDAKVFFQGVGKRDYWAGGAMMFGACQQGKWQAVVYEPQLDYFRPEDTTDPLGPNVDSYYPRVNWGGPYNTYTQTRYLQNAAYCRLKNVTIGYTLPKSISEKAHIEKLRVFVSGENLATMTKFTKMGDPELIEAYNSGYGFGKVYPLTAVFSFGLNVTF